MEKISGIVCNEETLRITDPSLDCENLSLQIPIGKVMAWSDDDVIAVKYPGYRGHCGGNEYTNMPTEISVYKIISCEISSSPDGFSEITKARVKCLLSFPIRKGNFLK